MQRLAEKHKLLFFPVLLIAVLWLLLYSCLHWAIIIVPAVTAIPDDTVNVWVPLIAPAIPIFIWVRPRLKLLKIENKKGRLDFLYMFICTVIIGGPAAITQHYLQTVTGKLTALPSITNISTASGTKYYSIQDYYADKSLAKTWYITEIIGKGRGSIKLKLYFVTPLEDVADEPVKITTNVNTAGFADTPKKVIQFATPARPKLYAWLCIYYDTIISNNKDKRLNNAAEDGFYYSTYDKFKRTNFRKTVYFDRIGYTNKRNGYLKAIYGKNFTGENIKGTILLEPTFTAFKDRNGHYGAWAAGVFCIGMVLWFLIILLPEMDAEKLAQYMDSKKRQQ